MKAILQRFVRNRTCRGQDAVVCLLGPTAAGKTDVAVCLAKKINAEIISCDSMQIYQGMDIASSKPTQAQLKKSPHYLINIMRPSQQYNAVRFAEAARRIIRDMHKRNKLPLIVAGTGLYLRALLDGIFAGPGANLALRKKFYQQFRRFGAGFLYQKLKKNDPQTAQNVHPNDLRRIIRALEVYERTGVTISRLQKKAAGIRDSYNIYLFGLARDRADLYARIEQRVDRMFQRGLVAEIKRLRDSRMSKTARSLLGYKEIAGFLDGEYSKEEAGELLKRNTRRYAKRQLSWFRREKDIVWVDVGAGDMAETVSEKICGLLGNALTC